MGRGNCGAGGRQKGIGAKLAVKQRPRGLAWVSPQDVSDVSDQKEEMSKASKRKRSGGVALTRAHAMLCSCPRPLAFCWQSAWGNAVDSSVLPQFICPQLRHKCSWHFLTFACSIFVSDLSLSSSLHACCPSCDGPLPGRGKSLRLVWLPGKCWESSTARLWCLRAKGGMAPGPPSPGTCSDL